MKTSDGSNRQLGWLTSGQWLAAGLFGMAVLGIIVLTHYGEGVDEWQNYTYGWAFVHAYERANLLTNPGIRYYNGPFFMMIWVVASQAIHWLIPSWMLVDGRHFTTFVTFLFGVWLLYRLSLRFMRPPGALFVTALFATQPVLFGHAFINQKDVPLMTFFLASVVVGWAAVDRLRERSHTDPKPRVKASDEWRGAPRRRRVLFSIGVALATLLLLDLWVFHGLLHAAEGVVRHAYDGTSLDLINRAFERVATDAYKTPVELYLGKVDRAVFWLGLVATAGLLVGAWWSVGKAFPESLGRRLRAWRYDWGLLVLTAVLVGATTSIRVVGPLAGALVAVLIVARLGRRSLGPVLALGLVAMLTTYLTWPVLWGDPIGQFSGHILQTTEFTSFFVLYAGRHFESTNLPWHYLPWLLAIQLTLPAGIAIVIGAVRSLWLALRRSRNQLGFVVLAMWVGIPSASVMLGWVSVYNNFRHELFILPPLFVLSGVGVEWISKTRLHKAVVSGLAVLMLVPGVIGIVRLHPYEYVYYNALIGGVDGATNRYELDYWCTAFRETMTYVDLHAPQGADIGVAGAMTSAVPYARPDLNLYLDRPGKTTPDLGIACHRGEAADLFPGLNTVFFVRRGSAVLAVVKAPGD
jgi:hypothetical protein